jgi:hypothetical protein
MARPEYRDQYDGRGKYALENDAMLDHEQSRLGEWQSQSTRYRATFAPVYFVAVGIVLAAAVSAIIYYLVAGGRP